jgi:hypothetical protein
MKIIILLLATITSFFSQGVFAENVEYDVEIIVFEDPRHTYEQSENWLPSQKETTSPGAAKKDIKPQGKIEFPGMEASKLGDIVERLNNSQEYNVLLHKIWRQPGLDQTQAISVHLDSSDTDTSKTGKSFIEGDIRLIMSRYLHITGTMNYHKQNDAEDGYDVYSLNLKRKMRSREIHYIDHPMFGIIVLATPHT